MKKRWQKFIILILAAFLIAITYLPSYSAQEDVKKDLCSDAQANLDNVCLDEQFLFHLKPEKLIPLPISSHKHEIDEKQRRDIVETKIKNIADDFSIEVGSIQVKPWNPKTIVIVSGDDVILTLTDADAERAGSNKENLAKLYLEKIRKSVREYRDKQIKEKAGEVSLEDQFLFSVYDQKKASNISKTIQEIADNYSILTNSINIKDFNEENPKIVSNGQIILTLTNEDAKLAGVEAKSKKKLAEIYLAKIKKSIQEYRKNQNFIHLPNFIYLPWSGNSIYLPWIGIPIILVTVMTLIWAFFKAITINIKNWKWDWDWENKIEILTLSIALIIFLILLMQLSVKFLEVTFLDIAGEGAVVILLKIIGFFLLLGLFYLLFNWLSGKGAGGIAVVPFEDRTTSKSNGENSNKSNELGKAVTDLFVMNLDHIINDQINKASHLLPKSQENNNCPSVFVEPEPMPVIINENWSASDVDFFEISPVKIGPIELKLSVGKFLIFLKRIWPFGGVETVINGNIQQWDTWDTKTCLINGNIQQWDTWDTKTCLITVKLKSPLKFKLLQVDFDCNDSNIDCNDSNIIFKKIKEKIKELAYQVAYELAANKLLYQTWQEFVYKLGNIYFQLKKDEEALNLYEEASQDNLNLWQPCHNAGVIRLYSDQQDLIDYDKAIEKFKQALAKFPESSVSYSGLGLAHFFNAFKVSDKKVSGVADFGYDFYFLVIAKLLHDQYFRLLDFYFHTLIQQQRQVSHELIKAENSINKAIKLDGTNASYYWNRGLIKFCKNDFAGAETDWSKSKNIIDAKGATTEEEKKKTELCTNIYNYAINASTPSKIHLTPFDSKQKFFLKFFLKDVRMLKKITNTADFDSLIQALQEAIEKPMVQRNLFQQIGTSLGKNIRRVRVLLKKNIRRIRRVCVLLGKHIRRVCVLLGKHIRRVCVLLGKHIRRVCVLLGKHIRRVYVLLGKTIIRVCVLLGKTCKLLWVRFKRLRPLYKYLILYILLLYILLPTIIYYISK